MTQAIATGAKVEAKRRPGLREGWHKATFRRFEGKRAIVTFEGDRDEAQAHKVREPKSRRAVRQPRPAPAAPPPLEGRSKITIILDCVRCGERPGGHAPPWGGNPSLCEVCLPLAIAEGPPPPLPQPRFSSSAQPRAVKRGEPPAESPAYLAWTRLGECINPGCGAPAPSDPHHEGAGIVRHGYGQKVPDHFVISLCRWCHTVRTGIPGHPSGCLPDPEASKHERTLILRSREESLAILRRALDERLSRAVALLPQAVRIELLARALAGVSEEVLEGALLGTRPDESTTGATT